MKLFSLRLLCLASLLSCAAAKADWAASSDPLVVKPRPSNGDLQPQNPPGFTWARHPGGPARYEVDILADGAATPSKATVERNWYLPTRALAAGSYAWRVRPAGSSNWSAARRFTIGATSTVFEVPDNATLRNRITQNPRPRSLPASFVPMSQWNFARMQQFEPYVSRMANEVKAQASALPALSDGRWQLAIASPLTANMVGQQTDVRNRINAASRQLEAAAMMYRLKGEAWLLDEAKQRGDQLASLNPNGPTSYLNQDQATRQIALALVKAVDMLADSLDNQRKARWLAAVTVRTNVIYANLAGDNGRLDQFPFDSHANTSLVFLALISTLGLGDIADAQKWFDFSFRVYANNPSPWSGPEGGYANGTAYAEYTAGYLVALWDPLVQATGVNFYAKPWSRGFLDFATQFTPPGARTHLFGDGSDTRPDPRVFHAFASRMSTPRAAWYVRQLGGAEDTLTLLEAPYPMPVASAAYESAPASTAYYPSIGWTAMHSDINSRARTSFYFKSSPYGSFNHSHGDQNAFLLSVAGQPLLISAGWYDWFASPYWNSWYSQTKAQNAITFDGGKGQVTSGYREQLQRNGRISGFSTQPGWDYAEGDATPAYAGQLSSAKRQVWYLRGENAILVRDKLSAVRAHTFEFNVHAPGPITPNGAAGASIAINGQSVCLRSLGSGAVYEARSGYAPKPGTTEGHGAFTVKGDGKKPAEFLVLLDVGCKNPVVKITNNANASRTVQVGAQTVVLY
ncbi:heparinase II/III domain-containing protein [Massilia psychrophila]|uniref:Heparinase n=1 Tax=Massilia psychrophila TaxID=1603353 RepID=A0A2G8SYB1_9BURK|nr:heparinase II/III family protein [Massilia psychrophila]PIL38790.1 heparinase [Massilia psychrophila]GGE73563.1 oligo alginate lyase [Massilia psychrophila]